MYVRNEWGTSLPEHLKYCYVLARISDIKCNALLAASKILNVLANISVAPSNVSVSSFSSTQSSMVRETATTRSVAIKDCRIENQLMNDQGRILATSLMDELVAFCARVLTLDGMAFISLGWGVVILFNTSCKKGRHR